MIAVFKISVGNIDKGEILTVKLSYAVELLDDETTDQAKFILSSTIGARYGYAPGDVGFRSSSGSLCTVNVDIEQVGPIKSISCPSSHPIVFELGRPKNAKSTSTTPDSHHASVRFTSQTFLSTDFVLSIKAANLDLPRAIAEPHPSPNHRTTAMALTLVPRFKVPDVKGGSEFIFLVDRSGSMGGLRMDAAKKALVVLLRGLPTRDTTFNVWSFGTSNSPLWKESKSYSASSLEEATRHIDSMSANYGGTEIQNALEAVYSGRTKSSIGIPNRPTNVFVLTDGDCWNVTQVVGSVANSVESSPRDAPYRVFCLGIGSGISTEMCEGIARAGTGFALFVADGEEMTGKCAKLVKAARTPPVEDIEIEWCSKLPTSFSASQRTLMDEDDEFEMVEEESGKEPPPKKIGLFDMNTSDDDHPIGPPQPMIVKPQDLPEQLVQQGPYRIPSLYPGVRFLVYALISDKVLPKAGKMPETITIRGKIKGSGDIVELEVPVQVSERGSDEGTSGFEVPIHTLAARRLIQCLEDSQHNFPTTIGSNADSLAAHIKAKIVQLGTTYQLTSKHTSFVAVDRKSPPMTRPSIPMVKSGARFFGFARKRPAPFPAASLFIDSMDSGRAVQAVGFGAAAPGSLKSTATPLFGGAAPSSPPAGQWQSFDGAPQASRPVIGIQQQQQQRQAGSIDSLGLEMSSTNQRSRSSYLINFILSVLNCFLIGEAQMSSQGDPGTDVARLDRLARSQHFDGSFELNSSLLGLVQLSSVDVARSSLSNLNLSDAERSHDGVVAVILALKYMYTKLADLEESWDTLSEKAVQWLEDVLGESRTEDLVSQLK
jgi:hypothetical protein